MLKHLVSLLILVGFVQFTNGQKVHQLPSQNDFHYEIKSWTTKDGLPQNAVNEIFQDKNNFIWLMTNEGIVKFDGQHFQVFTPKNTENLYASRIESAVMDSSGVIWASSSEGYLIRLENNVFSSFQLPDKNAYRTPIELSPKGIPLISNANKLYIFTGDTFETYLELPDKNIKIHNFFYNSVSELLYISSSKGIFTYQNGKTKFLFKTDKSDNYNQNKYLITPINADTVCLFSYETFSFFKGNRFIRSIHASDLVGAPSGPIIKQDSKGNIWASTSKGVLYFQKGKKAPFLCSMQQGLTSNAVKSIFEDRDGNIWIGTSDNGLNILSPKLFSKLVLPSSYNGVSTNGVLMTSDSSFWFARNCNGVIKVSFKDSTFQHYKKNIDEINAHEMNAESIGGECSWTIYQDFKKNIWIGGFGGGITRFNADETVDHFSYEENVKHTNLCFRQINSDEMWIGTNESVLAYNYSTNTFHAINDSLGIPHIKINFIYKDHKNRIWLSSNKGVIRIQEGETTFFSERLGNIEYNHFRYIHEDNHGNLWFGSYGKGLFFYEDNEFIHIPLSFPTSSDVVSWIGEYKGNFWMTSNNGMNVVRYDVLKEYINGNRDHDIDVIHFGNQDGLENDEFNGGFQSSGVIWNNNFYLPTIRDIAIFHPDRVYDITPSKTIITSVEIDGHQKAFSDTLHFPYDYKRLSLNLSTPIFNNFQNFKMEYKLEGFDDQWYEVDENNRQISFTTLTPREYKLLIRTRSLLSDKITTSSYSFVVETPFYRTVTFIIVSSFTLLLFIFTGIRWHLSNQKRREQELQKLVEERTRELEISKSNISAIIENTDDIVWSVDHHCRLIYANENFIQQFEIYTGSRPSVGENLMRLLPQELHEFWELQFERALSGEKFTITIDSKASGNPTQKLWIKKFYINPLSNTLGNVTGIVLFGSDITQTFTQQQELEKAKEHALAAAKSKSDFLATMSHEIRTPMNGVIGMTSLLLQTKLSEEQREYVETIRLSGDTLLSIINEILDFSKVDSGQLELEKHPFEIETVIRETFELLKTKAKEKGVTLSFTVSETVPTMVHGDITRVRQVLLNLVNNAVKFTNEGEIKVNVTTLNESLSDQQSLIQFAVSDTGIGIPYSKINKLFKPFSQLDSSTTRKYGGTGLGLAICKKLVDLMGGKIWVESTENVGTTFYFTIETETVDHKDLFIRLSSNLKDKTVIIGSTENSFVNHAKTLLTGLSLIPKVIEDPDQLFSVLKNKQPLAFFFDSDFEKRLAQYSNPTLNNLVIQLPQFLFTNQPIDQSISEKYSGTFPLDFTDTVILKALEEIFAPEKVKSFDDIDQLEIGEVFPLKILIAEDNLVNQKLATMILEKLGYVADTVANGVEAIESVNRQKYDIVFMDVQMPEMDGYLATRIITKQHKENRPIIIAMTANAMEGDRQRAIQEGMDDYLSKPISINIIRKTLIKWGRITKLNQHPKENT
ncbi:MAG: hypothetical protein CL843_05525 [Crocinitomicaceae bacterium]|nr:hypothetical protein [Crocinitomicaceae bacterium]|tara:strand:+ start:5067 stop:9458 length:4392 start_codon:yes stop_codon:yes gene_type:complete